MFRTVLLAVLVLAIAAPAQAAEYDVAPGGSGTECTYAKPCSLAYALTAADASAAGGQDTIYPTGGTYPGPVALTVGNVGLLDSRAGPGPIVIEGGLRVAAPAGSVSVSGVTVNGGIDVERGDVSLNRATVTATGRPAVRITGGSTSLEGTLRAQGAQPALVADGGSVVMQKSRLVRTDVSDVPLAQIRGGLLAFGTQFRMAGAAGTVLRITDGTSVNLNNVLLDGGARGAEITGATGTLYFRHLTQRANPGAADRASLVVTPASGSVSVQIEDSIVRDPFVADGAVTFTCRDSDVPADAVAGCAPGTAANARTADDAALFADDTLAPKPGGPAIDTASAGPGGLTITIPGVDAAGNPRSALGSCTSTEAKRDRGALEYQGGPQTVLSLYDNTVTAGRPLSWSLQAIPSSPQDTITWDFGDGTTSIAAQPLYAYTVPGTYRQTVTHRSGTRGCVVTRTATIKVLPAPAPPPEPQPPTPPAARVLADFLRLPPAGECRRRLAVNLRTREGVARFAARLGNGRLAVVPAGKAFAKRLPRGRTRVRVEIRLADGTVLRGARTYRRCRG